MQLQQVRRPTRSIGFRNLNQKMPRIEEYGGLPEHQSSGYQVAGLTDESIVLFLAQGWVKQGAGGGDESETITVHEIALEDILTWLSNRKTSIDLKLLAALYTAQFHLKVSKN